MPRRDYLSPERLGRVAVKAGPLLAAFPGKSLAAAAGFPEADALPPSAAIRLQESFRILGLTEDAWNLTPEDASNLKTLSPYLYDSGQWHHQVHATLAGPNAETAADSSGTPVAYLISSSGGEGETIDEVAVSPLAGAVEKAIAWIERKASDGGLPDDTLIRLISVPVRFLYAFSFQSASSGFEGYIIVWAPESAVANDLLPRADLLSAGEFLSGVLLMPGPHGLDDADNVDNADNADNAEMAEKAIPGRAPLSRLPAPPPLNSNASGTEEATQPESKDVGKDPPNDSDEEGGGSARPRLSGGPDIPPAVPPSIVEVITRVPHTATRVTVTIDVQPGEPSVRDTASAGKQPPDEGGGESRIETGTPVETTTPAEAETVWKIAGGRKLPSLLFVTDLALLAAQVGPETAGRVRDGIRAAGQPLLDLGGAGKTVAAAARATKDVLSAPGASYRGVVLVGGHEVVPLQRLDTLEPELRAVVQQNPGSFVEPDDFIVWSDDVYGDRDGDGIAELPVSRVPDGGEGVFLLRALSPTSTTPAGTGRRGGVRNIARPFADIIWENIEGVALLSETRMVTSGAAIHSSLPPNVLSTERLYLMLHGDWHDSSNFYGEQVAEPAVRLRSLPSANLPRVVFTGCCWGALIVDHPALSAVPTAGQALHSRNPKDSIALAFLQGGTTGFIGCTGVHYSPSPEQFAYGGPMHALFWRYDKSGLAPAEALFRAKIDYARGIPHGPVGILDRAVESKILREYCCLGLGW